ncbi:hypothetical protein BGX24_008772 [Mortierella sp. AD032]|nr:hypothetical protein BGX24_008772 [Mortierella sp. AD032]
MRSLSLTTATIAVLLLSLVVSTTSAQSTTAPIPVTAGGYATDGEKTLYIRGGSTTRGGHSPTNQFFSLNLTTSWTATSPAWTSLVSSSTAAVPATANNSLAMSGSNQLVEWSSTPGLTVFNLENGSSTPRGFPTGLTTEPGLQIAIDPSTGTANVPCGANNGDSMVQFNPSTDTPIKQVVMPSATQDIMQKIAYYSFVWSSVRKSFLLLGGFTYNNPLSPRCNEALWEFKEGSWSRVATRNMPFKDVSGHCMVPAANGTKMIVFGGQRATDWKPISGIYILDLHTMEWTSGVAAPLQEARLSMACAVSGDYFIAWGGESDTEIKGPRPLIYNMKTNQWVDQFISTVSVTSSSGSNTAAIIGGAVGAVVLIAVVIGLVIFRRRQQRKNAEKETTDAKSKDKDVEKKDGPKGVKKAGDDLKDPQGLGNNSSVTAFTAGTILNSDGGSALGKDGGEMVVDKDGRVVSRNPQSFIHTADLRNPQYQSGYPGMMYQNNGINNNPQYFEPGTQFHDMQYYPTTNNPQLYASVPHSAGVSGNVGVQSQDFTYPPPPPLAAMRRDSQARVMSLMVGNGAGGSAGTTAPMTEEILKLQLALVKAQQDQQFQMQQQNLARFRADQEAQLQMLQQQLMATSSASPSPALANAVSAPVTGVMMPVVGPLAPVGVSQSSMSAPVPTVVFELDLPSSPSATNTTVAVEEVPEATTISIPVADYVPAPVFASPGCAPAVPSSATSAATTLVTSAPVPTLNFDTATVAQKSAHSVPIILPRPPTVVDASPVISPI